MTDMLCMGLSCCMAHPALKGLTSSDINSTRHAKFSPHRNERQTSLGVASFHADCLGIASSGIKPLEIDVLGNALEESARLGKVSDSKIHITCAGSMVVRNLTHNLRHNEFLLCKCKWEKLI